MKKVNCLTCEAVFEIEDEVMEGEIVECTACGQEHEVEIKDNKVSLILAPEIEETWGE